MTIPEPLRYGDKVAIVATARKISPQETQPAIDMLKRWGLQPVVQQGLYEEYNQFAGTDRHRAEMLQNALDDDSIRAILCARGGYGTAKWNGRKASEISITAGAGCETAVYVRTELTTVSGSDGSKVSAESKNGCLSFETKPGMTYIISR